MTKHVETLLTARLDEGSSPSTSTKCSGHLPDDTRQYQDKPQDINQFCGFLVPKNDDSGPSSDKKTATDDYSLLCSKWNIRAPPESLEREEQ